MNHHIAFEIREFLLDPVAYSQDAMIIRDQCRQFAATHGTGFTVSLRALWERGHVEDVSHLADLVRDLRSLGAGKIFFLGRQCWQPYRDLLCSTGIDDAIVADFCAVRFYHDVIENKKSQVNDRWMADHQRFLFLTGKPQKPNRLRLLYKLDQSRLLGHCEWSLFVNGRSRQLARRYLPELTDSQYQEFIDSHQRNPDRIAYIGTKTFRHDSETYDHRLYADTSFSVIAETTFENRAHNPFITEKTWRAMANHHPFIMAADTGTLSHLESLGFRTFREYLARPDYDGLTDIEQRLQAVVENVRYWTENIQKHADDIKRDVQHNYDLYLQHSRAHIDIIDQAIAQHELNLRWQDLFPTAQLEPAKKSKLLFCDFYQSIKDPSWPPCTDEKDFFSLPDDIKKECQDLHGYRAPRPPQGGSLVIMIDCWDIDPALQDLRAKSLVLYDNILQATAQRVPDLRAVVLSTYSTPEWTDPEFSRNNLYYISSQDVFERNQFDHISQLWSWSRDQNPVTVPRRTHPAIASYTWPVSQYAMNHAWQLQHVLQTRHPDVKNIFFMGMHWKQCLDRRPMGIRMIDTMISKKLLPRDLALYVLDDCVLDADTVDYNFFPDLGQDPDCFEIEPGLYQLRYSIT